MVALPLLPAVGVKVAVYWVNPALALPLVDTGAKFESVPPVTSMSPCVKAVLASDKVK